ncbi:hypothetical protein ACEPAI_9032 [Sanghuangporus weigelae]
MHFKTLASLVLLSFSYLVAGAPSNCSSDSGPSPTTTDSALSNPSPSKGGNPTFSGSGPINVTCPVGGSVSGPQFVIYSDMWVDGVLPDPSKVEGYTVFALSFLTAHGAVDQAQNWASQDDSTRKSLKSKYSSAGIKLIVSAFGSEEKPTTKRSDPVKTANDMAGWVKQYDLDGIDVDYEDFDAMGKEDGSAEEWLISFTKALREQLPQGQYVLTHAPIAPWFSPEVSKSGAYLTVHKNVGDMIDWYNMQFYNQQDYSDCTTLLSKSKAASKASVFEISKSGVDLNKIVIGKPGIASDADDGYMEPKTLATCLSQAKQKGWNAGAMVWEYPHADSQWIKDARGDAFPMN